MWILDSGRSRHMTENSSLSYEFERSKGGKSLLATMEREEFLEKRSIGDKNFTVIENVLLIKGLKFNLISISQLCDKDHKVEFKSSKCIVYDTCGNTILFETKRTNNVYSFELEHFVCQHVTCLSASHDNAWLWHCGLGHYSMSVLENHVKRNIVQDMPKIKF